MTDIFKSADWAREALEARKEAARPDGIIGGPFDIEHYKKLWELALDARARRPDSGCNCLTCAHARGESVCDGSIKPCDTAKAHAIADQFVKDWHASLPENLLGASLACDQQMYEDEDCTRFYGGPAGGSMKDGSE